jgi:hypothetical protein
MVAMSEVVNILLILLYILIIGPILIGFVLLFIATMDGHVSLLDDVTKDLMDDLNDVWRR